eukprot:TRINITY_DN459_c0_g2_i1.p1 TRINITY_DN459_c0_g2~~TRINITY_DN459_c0_g2_i1.p1  ORF type:complete len:259 (-),score=34.21 TRINITY_DN459_c0_g2_i1:54-830(-)
MWVLLLLVFFASVINVSTTQFCSPETVQPILDLLFATTGNDCTLYVSLYAENATYYHQHDGFKTKPQLTQNCKNYATFCPGDTCRFLQNGAPMTHLLGVKCHVLVPYLWSEIPANHKSPGNLEPHTGWEYVVVVADNSSSLGLSLELFAEIETTYSVAYNWGNPLDISVYNWTVDLLKTTASKGECDIPIAPVITNEILLLGEGWRQQGSAVVLAVGGLCHVAVPYTAQQDSTLSTGMIVFVLMPTEASYSVVRSVIF